MHWHRTKRLLHLLVCSAIGFHLIADAQVDSPPASDQTPMPSAMSFDVLFKRLEMGDLSELDRPRQQKFLTQLQQLLPPGDAHRQRLLDSQRCGLNFLNAVKDGFAFADAKLSEALHAQDPAAAIRLYYCRSGYQSSLSPSADALDDANPATEMPAQRGDRPLPPTRRRSAPAAQGGRRFGTRLSADGKNTARQRLAVMS